MPTVFRILGLTGYWTPMSRIDGCLDPSVNISVWDGILTFQHRTAGPHGGFDGRTKTEAAGRTGAQRLPRKICLLERCAEFLHAPEGQMKVSMHE